jgi:hypothetical protein
MKFCHRPGIHYMEISLHFSVPYISRSFPVKKLKIKNRKNFEILHSCSGDCEDFHLLGCDTVQSSRNAAMFQGNLLP